MLALLAPQGADFPVMWWIWWFVVALAVYGLLGAWFWIGLRSDKASGEGRGETAGRR